MNDFQDIAYIANFTPQAQLIEPILRLQAVRSELLRLPVPECEAALKNSALDYMSAMINYLAFFMGGEAAENVDAGIQNSQQLWQVVVSEFNKVVSVAGVEPQEIPELSEVAPPLDVPAILVSNIGSQSVNVRAQPDMNAAILATLEPGMASAGLGRTGAGDWLQINMNGVIGWVAADAVSASIPVIDMPVVNEVP